MQLTAPFISNSDLSREVYKVNFCKSEKRILPLQMWMAM